MSGTGALNARYVQALTWIVISAFILRAGITIYAQSHPNRFDFPDSQRYLRVARNIAGGQGPVDSSLTGDAHADFAIAGTDPLYPAILSTSYLVRSPSNADALLLGRMINSLFGIGSILLLAALARRLFDDRTALLSALIFSIDPILLYFNVLVLSEWAYTFFLLFTVYSLVRFRQSQHLTWILISAMAGGLATLTRSTNLLFPILMLFTCIAIRIPDQRRPGTRAILATIAFLLMYGAVLLPEAIRKHRAFGEVVLTRTGGGASLLEGLGPWADGGPGMDRISYPKVPQAANEVERDRVYRNAALQWVRENPMQTISLAFKKLARTWSPLINATDYQNPRIQIISTISTIPVYLLALVGIWALRDRRDLLWFLLLPAIYFSLIHMVFVGSIRYRMPAMPFLFVLAAVGFFHLVGRHANSKHTECLH